MRSTSSPCAETMMIGTFSWPLSRFAIDKPSSPGNIRSRMIRSNEWDASAASISRAVGDGLHVESLLLQVGLREFPQLSVVVDDE